MTKHPQHVLWYHQHSLDDFLSLVYNYCLKQELADAAEFFHNQVREAAIKYGRPYYFSHCTAEDKMWWLQWYLTR